MDIMKELKAFAKKLGVSVDKLKMELEEIKEETKVKSKAVSEECVYAQALAQLKGRYALQHLRKTRARAHSLKKRVIP